MALSEPLPIPAAGTLRCRCASCGAHVTAQSGYRIAGQCQNCGSYELMPLDALAPVGTRPASPSAG